MDEYECSVHGSLYRHDCQECMVALFQECWGLSDNHFDYLACVSWEHTDHTLFLGEREFEARLKELGERVLWCETGGW